MQKVKHFKVKQKSLQIFCLQLFYSINEFTPHKGIKNPTWVKQTDMAKSIGGSKTIESWYKKGFHHISA